MQFHPLSIRVIFLSWVTALLAWPIALVCLSVFQGLGVLACGGSWIGVALPLGAQPWAMVNEPSITFASSQLGLYFYWLSPPIGALLFGIALVFIVPTPTTWPGMLFPFQLTVSLATLGLAWSPGLGLQDGTTRGLAFFFELNEMTYLALTGGAAFLIAVVAVTRFSGHLWLMPGGPLRSRRLQLAVIHVFIPVFIWPGICVIQGWPLRPVALFMLAAPLVGALFGAWAFSPHSTLRLDSELSIGLLLTQLVMGLAVAGVTLWAGVPAAGAGKALLWKAPGLTNNIRPNMVILRFTPRPFPKTPPVSSLPQS